ncbi:hypothetical protein MH1LPH_01640 [Lactiplantibacillus brownii]
MSVSVDQHVRCEADLQPKSGLQGAFKPEVHVLKVGQTLTWEYHPAKCLDTANELVHYDVK